MHGNQAGTLPVQRVKYASWRNPLPVAKAGAAPERVGLAAPGVEEKREPFGSNGLGGSRGEVGVVDGAHGFQVGIQLPAVGVLLLGLVLSVQGGQAIQE